MSSSSAATASSTTAPNAMEIFPSPSDPTMFLFKVTDPCFATHLKSGSFVSPPFQYKGINYEVKVQVGEPMGPAYHYTSNTLISCTFHGISNISDIVKKNNKRKADNISPVISACAIYAPAHQFPNFIYSSNLLNPAPAQNSSYKFTPSQLSMKHNTFCLILTMQDTMLPSRNNWELVNLMDEAGMYYEQPLQLLDLVKLSRFRLALHDCTIVCAENEARYTVPSYLLMLRSPVFKTMLSSGMKESEEKVIHIHGHSAVAVSKILEFIYNEIIELESFDEALAVYGIAHEYQMESLMWKCEEKFSNFGNVSLDRLCEIWRAACDYENKRLQRTVLIYACDQLKTLITSGGDEVNNANKLCEGLGSELLLYQVNRHPFQLQQFKQHYDRSLRDYIVGNYNQGKASLLNDCTITCTGTNGMLVHLYASSFILKLRSSALAEKLANGSNELDYTNFSASTVRAILKYCYQDDCIKQASSQEVLDLCTFASEYKITSMQKHCVNRLSSIIDRTIALDVWRLSKKYQVDSLKLVVLAFVTKNLKEMLKHNGSEQLAKDISAELGFELLLFQAGTHPLQR